jgi:hypothetical protein
MDSLRQKFAQMTNNFVLQSPLQKAWILAKTPYRQPLAIYRREKKGCVN